jgi:UDP-glucose 4-epimerase
VFTDYLEAYRTLHHIEYTSLALANVYGPRQDPHGEAGVVSIFAGRLLRKEPCTIFGTGEQTRDFVFVDDVVDAFVRAASGAKAAGLVVNIGTGVETSVNELYQAMAEAAGVDAPAEHEAARAGELARSALATGLAHAELGWEPRTDLPTGALATLDWFRAQRS